MKRGYAATPSNSSRGWGPASADKKEVHSDLQHLVRLQQLDSDIESARRRIADIPSIQQTLDDRLAEQHTAVAAIKQRLADSQTARREIEKEVASIQSRLSKYKDQLMEVKTNKEYQAMQKEIATAEESVRAHEDRILERMEEADTLSADLKAAEIELKRQEADVVRETDGITGRSRRPRTSCRPDVGDTQLRGSRAVAGRAEVVRARGEAAQRPGGGGSPRRNLHGLPRTTETAGVQRGPPRRNAHSVRQLPENPLLRPDAV